MKKVLVVLSVLLACFTLNAERVIGSSATTVGVTLALNPTYDFNVTTSAVTEADRTVGNVVDKSTGIVLDYNRNDLTLNGTTSDYYISYIFTEYKSCSFSVALDGNLTLDGGSEENASESVPFEAEIEVADNEKATLYSKDRNSVTLVKVGEDATMIAQKMYGSFGLSINPSSVEGEESLVNKKIGHYSANIVLTVTEA